VLQKFKNYIDQLLKKLMKYVDCKINASFAIGNAYILQQKTNKKIRKLLSACILYYCHKIEVFATRRKQVQIREVYQQ
jgi:hypothetical protein